jgi:hypothetical protein
MAPDVESDVSVGHSFHVPDADDWLAEQAKV